MPLRAALVIARRRGAGGPGPDDAGVTFITTLFVVFFIGLMLFAFAFMNQSEAGFAANDRNSTIALGLAEAGVHEALNRLRAFGGGRGTFTNSLAAASPNSVGTVTYQAALADDTMMFPILSVATYGGIQRAARELVQAAYRPGFGGVVLAPTVVFQGDASLMTGDAYSATSVTFPTSAKSPAPTTRATATNLIAPQVMAGVNITTQSGGPGDFFFECADDSTTEVAPTACARQTNLPVNWHPGTPQAMTSSDFTAVVQQWNGASANLPPGLQVVQATRGAGVTYAPAGTYTPMYWSTVSATNRDVFLIVATNGPFCVNNGRVTAGVCGGGGTRYGDASGGGAVERYLDWGLVLDDLTRTSAQTFFQAPTCATCNAGGPNHNQNGIRYVPIVPVIDALAIACQTNIMPGVSTFANVSGDGRTCGGPPTGVGTFTGTATNPEFLVIDNGPPGGTEVTITGSGSAAGCSDDFSKANWGVIVATGDVNLQDFAFDGFIYTPGNVYSFGHNLIKGGIFSASSRATEINQMDGLGAFGFCGGTSASVPFTSTFFTFASVSWVDRPANQP